MNSELADYRHQFEAAAEGALDLVRGLTDSQFNWRPMPGKWSIAQCLEHLNSAFKALPRFDRIFAYGRSHGLVGTGPFPRSFLGKLYIRFMEPPVRIRFKSPKLYRPKPDQPLEEVVSRFLQLQEELIRRVEESHGLDLARLRMSSPITRHFKMSVAEWFAFLAAHQRRHLWQARQVRSHPAFPPV